MISSIPPGDVRLRVETVDSEDAVRIIINGEADYANLEQLATALASIELDGHRAVQIDVSDLDFVDAAGLRQLTTFAVRLRQSGRDVTTRGAQPLLHQVARILDVKDQLRLT